MSEEETHFSRTARRLNMEQIARYNESGLPMEVFITSEFEDTMATVMIWLMQRHKKELAQKQRNLTLAQ